MILEKINKISKEKNINGNIAQAILCEISKQNGLNLNIVELAEKSGCSQPTVTRFVRTLGLENFKKLVKAVNFESLKFFPDNDNTPHEKEIMDGSDILSDVRTTLENIDHELFEQIALKIVKAKKINIAGMGGNETLKVEIEHKLSQIGKHVLIGKDWHQQLINLHFMSKDDLTIIISYSGDKFETLKVAQESISKKVPVLAITGNFDSQLRQVATYSLLVYSNDPKYRTFSITSKVAALALWDLLFKKIITHDILKPDVAEAWRWETDISK
ncbi:hypothetical protein ESOMN_v1c05190 [Williamsoniiplasma somnilux]|uniref:SIS domain-containing protein n=1 Tax=Williamsoniiplasma somnilux TaxID=215578 RepID=A0A2K8P1L6_9MOLU|nr:MurR/RpiR family transcriptional regulator [Williamsoniiplasma somnilux]ATZ18901.1 hypothetical protein ESOMN_v1c05190 [Williamsoniiplasma somnilux]